MSIHQRKYGRWIAKFPKGPLPDDPGRNRNYFNCGIQAEATTLSIAYYCDARPGELESLSLKQEHFMRREADYRIEQIRNQEPEE